MNFLTEIKRKYKLEEITAAAIKVIRIDTCGDEPATEFWRNRRKNVVH